MGICKLANFKAPNLAVLIEIRMLCSTESITNIYINLKKANNGRRTREMILSRETCSPAAAAAAAKQEVIQWSGV